MTSRINAKVPVRTVTPSPAPEAYSPSVPISLYREVATELQTNQALLESLKAHNRELTEQNQQLRVEIERVVQSALQLRQKADSFQSTNSPQSTSSAAAIVPHPSVYGEKPPAPRSPRATKTKLPEPPREEILFSEQPSHSPTRTQTAKSADVNGWWLALIICSIVVTAFGTGFLIVRPLLPQR